MNVDLVKQCLKFDATALAGMFAGAAMYINAADNPARMTLDTVNCRKHWMEAYNRARIFQVKFKLIYLGGLKENFKKNPMFDYRNHHLNFNCRL